MTTVGFIRKNLLRRKLRTALLLFATFVVFLLFGVLMSVGAALQAPDNGSDRRLLVLNKLSLREPLPLAYVDRISKIDGVATLAYASWMVGDLRSKANPLFLFAVDSATFFDLQQQSVLVSDANRRAFAVDRMGALVGETTAQKYHIKVGDRLPATETSILRKDGSRSWIFRVDGIYQGVKSPNDAVAVYVHYGFLNSARVLGQDMVDMIWVLPSTGVESDQLAGKIDRVFANSPAETHTANAGAYAKAFLAQVGDIGLIILLVMGAAFFTLFMIVANTMVISFRERRREIAILKAMGYTSRSLLVLIFGETLLLAGIGGALGLFAAGATLAALRRTGQIVFQAMDLSATTMALGVAVMIALALISALVPALTSFSLRPSTVLARG